MSGKVGKIIIDVVLSFMFFIVAAIILDAIAQMIFGKKSGGGADVNGHVMLVIDSLLTLAFAVWFYKFVHLGKNSKEKE